jgi:hypothetical protein
MWNVSILGSCLLSLCLFCSGHAALPCAVSPLYLACRHGRNKNNNNQNQQKLQLCQMPPCRGTRCWPSAPCGARVHCAGCRPTSVMTAERTSSSAVHTHVAHRLNLLHIVLCKVSPPLEPPRHPAKSAVRALVQVPVQVEVLELVFTFFGAPGRLSYPAGSFLVPYGGVSVDRISLYLRALAAPSTSTTNKDVA